MNMITKLATKMLAVLSVVAMIASPAAAQGLSASDMTFAFGGKAAAPAAVQQTARVAAPKAAEPMTIASARGMTQTEMQETEGAWIGPVFRVAWGFVSKPRPKVGAAGGPGAGRNFSPATREAARESRCVFCGTTTVNSRTPQPNRRHIDHAIPRSRGGNNSLNNAQNTCQSCNLRKGTQTTREFQRNNSWWFR